MATPVATERLLTVEEFEELPAAYDEHGNELAYELVDGQLVAVTPPAPEHGIVALRLGARLLAFVEAHALGWVWVEGGVVLRRAPDTVRGPDVAYVRSDRLGSRSEARQFFAGAPDLAAEVVSPSDRATEVFTKVQEYLAAGTRLVWVLEPTTRSVTAYTPGGAAHLHLPGAALDGGDVLPGFTVPVAELFDPPRADAGPA